MAISEAFSGSETVGTSEWSMTTDTAGPDAETSDGVFQAFVDFNAMTAADQFQFAVYEKTISSSTQRLVYYAILSGVQSCPVWASPSLILMHGWDMTVKKITGTDRPIDWSIRKVA